jgi:hypothetical protein
MMAEQNEFYNNDERELNTFRYPYLTFGFDKEKRKNYFLFGYLKIYSNDEFIKFIKDNSGNSIDQFTYDVIKDYFIGFQKHQNYDLGLEKFFDDENYKFTDDLMYIAMTPDIESKLYKYQKDISPSYIFSYLGYDMYYNSLAYVPEIKKIMELVNQRCISDSALTLTLEYGYIYNPGFNVINKKTGQYKTITKRLLNRGFNKTKFNNPRKHAAINISQDNIPNYMVLCLNKKKKTKRSHAERECVSSIVYSFNLSFKNDLAIVIQSKTPENYRQNRYNKLLRLVTVLIYYSLFTQGYLYKCFNNIINDVYIESDARNPISIFALVQMGFKVISKFTGECDNEITDEIKTKSVKEISEYMNTWPYTGFMHLRYYINTATLEDIDKIRQQVTELIKGTTRDNKKTLKCLDNKNNRLQNFYKN